MLGLIFLRLHKVKRVCSLLKLVTVLIIDSDFDIALCLHPINPSPKDGLRIIAS